MHRVLKSSLSSRQSDIAEVVRQFEYIHRDMNLEILANIAESAERRRPQFRGALWAYVVGHISIYALLKIEEACSKVGIKVETATPETLRSMQGWRLCTGSFKRRWGLPCPHTIRARVLTVDPLSVDDFDAHWRLDRSLQPEYRYDNVAQPPLIVPRHRHDNSNNRRMRSEFERVDREIEQTTRQRLSQAARVAETETTPGAQAQDGPGQDDGRQNEPTRGRGGRRRGRGGQRGRGQRQRQEIPGTLVFRL